MVLESTSRPGQDARSSARWWGGLFLAVAGLSVLRLPRVRGHVERSVDDEIASGRLADTTQRALAVNLGVATALAVSVVALLVVLWIARWAGSAFGLPEVGSGPARVPGAVVVVGSILLLKQVATLATGATSPRSEPVVWVVAATALVLTWAVIARATPASRRLRVLPVTAALGLLAVLV